jgi:hypothetical protein
MFRGAFRFPFGPMASLMILLLVAIVAGAAQSRSQAQKAASVRGAGHATGQR